MFNAQLKFNKAQIKKDKYKQQLHSVKLGEKNTQITISTTIMVLHIIKFKNHSIKDDKQNTHNLEFSQVEFSLACTGNRQYRIMDMCHLN